MNAPIMYANERLLDERLSVTAPGRINLIGEHTDYSGGFVLPATIDRNIWFSARRTDNNRFVAHSIDLEQRIQFSTDIDEVNANGWARYFQAALLALREAGKQVGGVHVLFSSDLPIGAGLSSSAALTCGLIYALDALHDWGLSSKTMALLAQRAEHLTGVRCGIMDQFTVMHGRRNHFLLLDCHDLSFDYVPFNSGDYRLVLINSMVHHELASSAYNERRATCERAMELIRSRHSEITLLRKAAKVLPALRSELGDDYEKIAFVVEENRRVLDAAKALKAGDMHALGQLMYQSHEGLSRQYQVSCAELDLLVELARHCEGVLGARMMGGGFGGCTINLIHKDHIYPAMRWITRQYEARTGIEPRVYEIQIDDGIRKAMRKRS